MTKLPWKCTFCQNREFIAFMAHWGFTFFLMKLASYFNIALIPAALILIVLAAAKEIWDIKYESNHPFWPVSVGDFAGYLFGILLGLWF